MSVSVKEVQKIGGKAENLIRLKKAGFNVPRFEVIPAERLKTFLSAEGQLSVPPHLVSEILSAFDDNVAYFAVRSSATGEDGKQMSFAGQFETYLNVTREDIAEKIAVVFSSADSARVKTYSAGLNEGISVSVIIQEMIEADVSGVAFGIDPVTGEENIVVNSVWGLGEGLVSGLLDADTFIVNESVEKRVVAKRQRYSRGAEGINVMLNVEDAYVNIPSLDDKQVKEISSNLRKIEQLYGSHMDVEFCFHSGTLYILQARPVTKVYSRHTDNYIVWDNSNIVESYPGVTTPLTFSFILPVYEAVYRQFTAMMGVSEKEISEHQKVYENMLGLLKGRVYYNLYSWYKLLSLLPGYSLNAAFMENMMGVKEKFVLKDLKKRSRFSEYLRVLKMIGIAIRNLRSLPEMKDTFLADLESTLSRFSKIDFDSSTSAELMLLYEEFEQTLLKKWKAPLVNDFFAMIYFGVMQKMTLKYFGEGFPNLHNDLLSGSKDIISAEPVKRLMDICRVIDRNENAKQLFLSSGESEIIEALKDPQYNELNGHIQDYFKRFGERCVGELKLETISYNQDPESFIRIIRSYVRSHSSVSNHKNLDLQLREKAEQIVDSHLKNKYLRKFLFTYVLKKTRWLVSNRENLRYERTRAFGVVRQMFSSIGKNFMKQGHLENNRDIFYLTKEEIFSFIRGTSFTTDLRSLVNLRKEEYAEFTKLDIPERIKTYGIVNSIEHFTKRPAAVSSGDLLKGIGCCPGIVQKKVRVVSSPSEIAALDGDILVTSSTDPGWITLFPSASAILVERGSLLSHSAIVSREMGIPCVVGITGLLATLKTGDVVEMNGSTGEVKIITRASA